MLLSPALLSARFLGSESLLQSYIETVWLLPTSTPCQSHRTARLILLRLREPETQKLSRLEAVPSPAAPCPRHRQPCHPHLPPGPGMPKSRGCARPVPGRRQPAAVRQVRAGGKEEPINSKASPALLQEEAALGAKAFEERGRLGWFALRRPNWFLTQEEVHEQPTGQEQPRHLPAPRSGAEHKRGPGCRGRGRKQRGRFGIDEEAAPWFHPRNGQRC